MANEISRRSLLCMGLVVPPLLLPDAVYAAIGFVTPEQFGAVGDDRADDSAALQAMLGAMGARRAIISRTHRTNQTLVIPRNAIIDFGATGKIRHTGEGAALDCSAGGFHLIDPHIQGPGKGPGHTVSAGLGTGVWIDGVWGGPGEPPRYVEGGIIDRPRIYEFRRSAIETRLWANGVVRKPRIRDCGYGGVLNQNSIGFRGFGPGLIENIGPDRTGNAYGHTNTRRTDGFYDPDLVASPRSINARVYEWTSRNIPWNGFDSHAGEDIVYIDCVAEECSFPFGLVGSSGTFGIQRSGLIRPVVRNSPEGWVYRVASTGRSDGFNPAIVIKGSSDGHEAALDCFVIDALFEYTGEDALRSGCISLLNTENAHINGVTATNCLGSVIVVRGGINANTNFLVENIRAIGTGSQNKLANFAVNITNEGGSWGTIRNVSVEQNGEVEYAYPILAAVHPGSRGKNETNISGIETKGVPAIFQAR